jgi:D-serine deaminase-like pyridoxal phosphate-dependent protein
MAAERLRSDGLPCPVVSVGSTPTALSAADLLGVTEVRAGVYVFFDLVMANVGVCAVSEIALSVLTTVIGHNVSKGWVVVDAGWMAMSRDRGTQRQRIDYGYGAVCDIDGRPVEDLAFTAANQEHGLLAMREDARARDARPLTERWPVGTRLRILPNHACATGAQFSEYHAFAVGCRDVSATWARFDGW